MIGSILTSGILGTLTGIFGNALNALINFKMQEMKNKHEQNMAELDMKTIIVEAREAAKIKKVEVEGEVEKSINQALEKSYDYLSQDLFDKSYMKMISSRKFGKFFSYIIALMFALVDFLKHLARPLITYYMLAVSTIITYLCYKLLQASGGAITAAQAFTLFQNSILVLLYLTTTCVGWWFADRRVGKYMQRLNDGNAKKSDSNFSNITDKFTK